MRVSFWWILAFIFRMMWTSFVSSMILVLAFNAAFWMALGHFPLWSFHAVPVFMGAVFAAFVIGAIVDHRRHEYTVRVVTVGDDGRVFIEDDE